MEKTCMLWSDTNGYNDDCSVMEKTCFYCFGHDTLSFDARVWIPADELLAYRQGFDPSERMPEGGKVVLIHYGDLHSDLLETATYDPVLERWNVILFADMAVVETDEIDRWYPAPGGE